MGSQNPSVMMLFRSRGIGLFFWFESMPAFTNQDHSAHVKGTYPNDLPGLYTIECGKAFRNHREQILNSV